MLGLPRATPVKKPALPAPRAAVCPQRLSCGVQLRNPFPVRVVDGEERLLKVVI